MDYSLKQPESLNLLDLKFLKCVLKENSWIHSKPRESVVQNLPNCFLKKTCKK